MDYTKVKYVNIYLINDAYIVANSIEAAIRVFKTHYSDAIISITCLRKNALAS